ncbi:hypothetical protein BPNSA17_35060 [Bordetella petrii]|uniref:Uncharacterized protein n=1 Tax=Bordetella genomosp. 2 TaxID=1983456 RepID=A0A261W0R6_9BORD|nr:hypothetical protein CAL24_08375 [Bordetella genomosp. 2]
MELRRPFGALARPFWRGPRQDGEPVGKFREDLERELIIWRPILAGHASLADVKAGRVDLLDLLKINALLDAQEAAQEAAARKKR